MSIYTKKGDKGTSTIINTKKDIPTRLPKSDQIFVTLGSLDELNSYLGVIISSSENTPLNLFLTEIQVNLFTINSILAGAKIRFSSKKTKELEKKIDTIDKIIPPLQNFILPGGSQAASHLHFARTLARRVERNVIRLQKLQPKKISPPILTYLNRLSDTLFTLVIFLFLLSNLDP